MRATLEPATVPVAWQPAGDARARLRARRSRSPLMATDEREERDLVARARGGEREAFEALVGRHADRLYAVVVRFCGDAHEAEEITQEAFLRAWRSLPRFEGRSQFFTWLYRIAINEAKRRGDRRRTHATAGSLDVAGVEIPDWRDAPQRRAERQDLQRALERAIAALPADRRLPLILRDVEGLSTAQAAEVMGLGEAAFKSRLHRARMAVRDAVSDFLPGDDR